MGRTATITFLTHFEGGRREPPNLGKYCTIVKFPEQQDPEHPYGQWSLIMNFIEKSGLVFKAQIRFLMDEAPHELIYTGNTFDVYEGPFLVAHGVVN